MRWILFVWFLCVFGGLGRGQSSFKERITIARTASEDRLKQIASLEEILEGSKVHQYRDTVGLIQYAIAFRYRILEDHLQVIDHANEVIEAFVNSKQKGYQYAFSLSFLGESYEALNQDKESLDAYFRILEIEPYGRELDVYGYAINEIARKFIQYEDYESAIPVIDQFLTSEHRQEVQVVDLIRILLSSSIAHSNLKGTDHLEKSKSDIDKAKELYNSLGEELELGISIDMQNAALGLFANEPNASEKYNELFAALNKRDDGKESSNEGLTMIAFNASFAFQKAGDFNEALQMAKTAKKQFQHYGIKDYIESEYLIYDNLATACLGLGQIDSAQYYIHRGLELFPNALEVIPSRRKFLLNLLYDKAEIFYAQREETPSSLDSALHTLLELDNLFDLHIAEQVSEYSINNLKNLGLKYYQLAIDISYLLNDQNRFWYFSEKTKGLQLLKSHIKRRNGTGTGRQQSIIDSIKRSVVLLETEINQASKANKTELESRLSTNRAQIVTLQREALNKDQSIKPYDLATMIDILDREELVLQYQYGRENLYLQIVNNSRSYIEKIGKSDSINSSILKMREVITESVSTMNEFDEISSSLYNSLVLNKLSDRSELFIIPDRELFYLPFEILRENDSEPYLIEDYDVSYLPSGSFRLPDSDHTDIDEIIVYKPNYIEGSNSIPPLPFIDAEIASIKRAFKIELISQNDDLSVDFLQIIKQAQVLHFGGHAILDGDNNEQSYLALGHGEDSNSRLRLGELYTAECGSELVTLSACNTGMGGILDGEGISSITRGFLYSGARAVVNTLWTVDDQSTSSIIGLFYEYLKQGKSKSHALRLAKLEYLQQAETYRRHPYYWAGVIGMGDMSQPIVYPTNWIKVILTIIMAVALTWFLTWRFNEKPMRKIVFLSDWEGLVNDRKKK